MPSHTDYAQALKRIEELMAQLSKARESEQRALLLHQNRVDDLATERAAREQAEKQVLADADLIALATEHQHQAERERDAALARWGSQQDTLVATLAKVGDLTARVKELEADRHEYVVKLDALREQIHEQAIAGREDGKLISELKDDSRRSDSLRVAEVAAARIAQQDAETALASARTLAKELDDALENDGPLLPIQYKFRAWLTSHPAQVAAARSESRCALSINGQHDWYCKLCMPAPVASPCADTCPACAAEILGMDTEEGHVGAACMHAPDLDEPPVAAPTEGILQSVLDCMGKSKDPMRLRKMLGLHGFEIVPMKKG